MFTLLQSYKIKIYNNKTKQLIICAIKLQKKEYMIHFSHCITINLKFSVKHLLIQIFLNLFFFFAIQLKNK